MSKRHIFVTNALPYANGDIHLGHLVGYIQADIWVRFLRMHQHQVHYICADDTHGAPIMLKAEELGITPEALIEAAHQKHAQDFKDFAVEFDEYYTTHSEENRLFAEKIYLALKAEGLIATRQIEQFFDEEKQLFLPDRFIKGECPKCHTKDQYGDNCENCGAAYQPTDLIRPYSVLSGVQPVMKASEHFFFTLSDPRCVKFLRSFLQQPDLLPVEAYNKLKEWLGQDDESALTDWDISRDAPYFGFPIPDAPNKYFYVWLDAPIGYFAALQHYAEKQTPPLDYLPLIHAQHSQQTEMVHFIGKDILYFHALFWPAMLNFSGYRTPTQYRVNGFLTVNGQKMSKSRGTFINARHYLDQGLNPEHLRYYFAAKSTSAIEDVDLNLADFVARVNSDLLGKYINIASRASGFITKRFNNQLAEPCPSAHALIRELQQADTIIATAYEKGNYAQALKEVAHLCDCVNAHVDSTKPWELAKSPTQQDTLHALCSAYIECFRLLTLYLKPVLPHLAATVEQYLQISPMQWSDTTQSLSATHTILPYQHLMTRIDPKQTEALLSAPQSPSKNAQPKQKEPPMSSTATQENESDTITIDQFAQIDLRLGKVLHCQTVEGSDKLLQFSVDLGEAEPRNIFSGIREFYDNPTALIGQHVIVVANLAPRKMRFGISQGMILSAATADALNLLTIKGTLAPGAKIS